MAGVHGVRRNDYVFSKKMFSIQKRIAAEKIKDYENGVSRWYDAAEELYPRYCEMSRKQRYVLKAKIDNYVGYSI